MKAEIDQRGVLHVIPETETEAYALSQWKEKSGIRIQISEPMAAIMRGEQHWRANCLSVSENWPRKLGDRP